MPNYVCFDTLTLLNRDKKKTVHTFSVYIPSDKIAGHKKSF